MVAVAGRQRGLVVKVRIRSNPGDPLADDRVGRGGRAGERAANEIALEHLAGRAYDQFLAVTTKQFYPIYSVRASDAAEGLVPSCAAFDDGARGIACLLDPDHNRRAAFSHRSGGMDRLIQHNVLAMSGRAGSGGGQRDTICPGEDRYEITLGNRRAGVPLPG